MKHNNQLPNAHLRKHWQSRVKTWFDQAGRKKRRRLNRQKKAAAVAPRPLDKLRPAVRCPTIRYNTKVREGRGFSLEEIKAVGLTPMYARTIGVSVDHRRRNRSTESLERNVQRLKAYLSKLVLYSKKNGKGASPSAQESMSLDTVKSLSVSMPVVEEAVTEDPRAVTPEEASFEAFKTLRLARIDARRAGIRAKRAKAKEEEEASKKK